MFCYFGHRPVSLPVIVTVLSLACATSYADPRVPLTISEAEDLAIRSEPGHAALLAREEALEEAAVAAGQLPDPALRVGLLNFPISNGGFSTEGMTQAQLGLRQEFPRRRTRALRTARLKSLARELGSDAEARSRDVINAARAAWLDVYYWQRARRIVADSRPFFADLVAVTRSMYAVGRKTQYDVLRAELELSRLDDRLLEAGRFHSEAQARLSEWLGADAFRPVAMTLPAWEQLPARADMATMLDTHPSLRAAEARVTASASDVDLAEERFKPGWALDLGYGYREGFLPSGEPRSDFVSLSVTVDLPFFGRNRQDRQLAAALGEKRAAVSSMHALKAELESRLTREYARWSDLTRRLTLYESRILGQSEGQARAALLAYQSDTGDFADVMRGYIDDLNTRLEHIRLQVDRAQSYAVLANLGGLSR